MAAREGLRFLPIYGRQAFEIDGRFRFWGGLPLGVWGGCPGLVDAETAIARKQGVEIQYAARVTALLFDGRVVTRVRHGGAVHEIAVPTVLLPSGGFEANAEWRIDPEPQRCSMPISSPFRASTRRTSWSAASSTSTIRAARG